MNKQRRAALSALCDRLAALNLSDVLAEIAAIASDLEELENEEQDAFDNLPESLQDGERGQDMVAAIDAMQNARESLEAFADLPELDEVSTQIDDARGQA